MLDYVLWVSLCHLLSFGRYIFLFLFLEAHQAQLDQDDDVCMEKDDSYNFDEYF